MLRGHPLGNLKQPLLLAHGMARHRPLRVISLEPIRLRVGAVRVFARHAHLAVAACRVDRAPAHAVAGV
jgi:hypothetical protein